MYGSFVTKWLFTYYTNNCVRYLGIPTLSRFYTYLSPLFIPEGICKNAFFLIHRESYLSVNTTEMASFMISKNNFAWISLFITFLFHSFIFLYVFLCTWYKVCNTLKTLKITIFGWLQKLSINIKTSTKSSTNAGSCQVQMFFKT